MRPYHRVYLVSERRTVFCLIDAGLIAKLLLEKGLVFHPDDYKKAVDKMVAATPLIWLKR